MIVDVEMFRGSYINYTWDFDDDIVEESYWNDFVTHDYELVGNIFLIYILLLSVSKIASCNIIINQ